MCCMAWLSLEFVKVYHIYSHTLLFYLIMILICLQIGIYCRWWWLSCSVSCTTYSSLSQMSHKTIWPVMVEHTHCPAWRSRVWLVISFHGVIEERSRAYAVTEFLWAKAFLRLAVLMQHSSVAPTTTCFFRGFRFLCFTRNWENCPR